MYSVVLWLHSALRWVVLLVGILAALRAVIGWLNKKEWVNLDQQVGLLFTISMDVQVLLGFLLYLFLSPITKTAFTDFGAAMSNQTLRFFALEHIFYMILALILVHAGRALAKRSAAATDKHKKAAVSFSLAMAVVFLAIPW